MTILAHNLKSDVYDQILTEIRYLVASARATEREIISIKLTPDASDGSKALSAVMRTLKLLKKEGKIDFFVSAEDFLTGTAESSYLINKFPDVTVKMEEENSNFIVKL